jgi:serine/threonine-protein kinase
MGSPLYMSPEQLHSSRDVDARSDVWALGVILYELVTGTVPFPMEATAAIAAIAADPILPPHELRKEIPEGLERAIMRALEKDREKRFQTVRELALALAPFAAEEELALVPAAEALPRKSIPDLGEVETVAPPANPATPVPAIPRAAKTPGVTTSGAMAAVSPPSDNSQKSRHGAFLGVAAVGAVLVALVAWRLGSSSASVNATTQPTAPLVLAAPTQTKAETPAVVSVVSVAASATAVVSEVARPEPTVLRAHRHVQPTPSTNQTPSTTASQTTEPPPQGLPVTL